MLLVYENKNTGLSSEWKEPVHVPPHLHEAIEVVYVTDGEVELGVGPELFHMDEGDFAIIFPNVIHHYQVFGKKKNKVIYLYLDPKLFPSYYKELQNYSPENPVVKKRKVHPDVVNAIKYLAEVTDGNPMLIKAYAQMILAHVFTTMPLINKSAVGRIQGKNSTSIEDGMNSLKMANEAISRSSLQGNASEIVKELTNFNFNWMQNIRNEYNNKDFGYVFEKYINN